MAAWGQAYQPSVTSALATVRGLASSELWNIPEELNLLTVWVAGVQLHPLDSG